MTLSGRHLISDHFDGRRFRNQAGVHLPSFRDVQRMLLTKRTPWPAHVHVQQRLPVARQSADEIVVTFIGHSTFLMQTASGNVLTDPVYGKRVGPFGLGGPRRVREPGVAFEDLPEIAVVLLSHNHYDHCDIRALRLIAKRFSPLFITPLGNARLLRRAGARNVEELDWWENSSVTPFPVFLTPAQHFSARTPFDRNRALWGGFVLSPGGRNIFFAGDSGYAGHFSQVREHAGSIDVAILPIGAYEPRWFMKPIHMNPDEAVSAHSDLQARQSIASHFGTYQLTLEAIDEPVVRLSQALVAAGIAENRFRALDFGESFTLDPTVRDLP